MQLKKPKDAGEYRDMTIAMIGAYPIPGKAPIELIKQLYEWGDLPEVQNDPRLQTEDRATLFRCKKLLKGIIDLRRFKEILGDI